MKRILSILGIVIISSMLVATSIILAQDSLLVIDNTYNNISNYSEVVLPNKVDYDDVSTKNALKEDINQKSHSNSAIVYYISWGAVFHKFGFLTHILGILEKNPNKEIYVFTLYNVMNLSFLSEYPNIKTFTISQKPSYENNKLDLIDYKLITTINELNNKNKLIDFYSDDILILRSAYEILQSNYININYLERIIQKFSTILYKTNSVNLFADGTASTQFYSTHFYNWFGIYENNHNKQSNSFETNIAEFNKYKNVIDSNGILSSKYVNDYRDIFYFFMSPLVTHLKSNNYTKSKYFVPSSQMVIDENDNLSIKRERERERERELVKSTQSNFFDPYNTLSSGLINAIKQLNQKSFSNLLMALNTPIKSLSRDDAEFEFMDNSINYVYSGRHTGEISANELNKECEKLYMLYNMALSSNNQSTNKINIIFKPHPRDSSEQNVLKTLKVALSNLYPNLFPNANDITWLYTINKNIPFELYISNGIFEDYSLKNRKVNIFGTYSTIFLMTYDYNLSANVSHFLLSQSDESAINYSFGTNSQLFPHSKRINI